MPQKKSKKNVEKLAEEARIKALAQWRGIDLTEQEMAISPTDKTISELVPEVIKKLKLEERRQQAEIVNIWNTLIDPNITAHAQPTALVRGTLIVNVDSSVWLNEIVQFRRQEILKKLQDCFGKEKLKRISFRIG